MLTQIIMIAAGVLFLLAGGITLQRNVKEDQNVLLGWLSLIFGELFLGSGVFFLGVNSAIGTPLEKKRLNDSSFITVHGSAKWDGEDFNWLGDRDGANPRLWKLGKEIQIPEGAYKVLVLKDSEGKCHFEKIESSPPIVSAPVP